MPSPAPQTDAPLVLLCGDDEFSVKQRALALYQEWCAKLGGMDHEIIDAAAANGDEALRAIGKLREAINTLPFFGGAKAVWFKNCTFLGDDRTASSAAVTSAMTDLAAELKTFVWQNVCLLISAGKVDKRKSFYKTLEKVARVEAFVGLSLETKDWEFAAERHVQSVLAEMHKDITDDALGEIVLRVGPQLRQLQSETEKLALYVGDRPRITIADVHAICMHNKQARAFALSDALGDRNLPELLKCLDKELWGMQFDKEKSEIGILYGLITKVRTMILNKEMIKEGWIKPENNSSRFKTQLERIPVSQFPEDKRYNPKSIHPFVLFKAHLQCQKYSQAELVNAMERLLACNLNLVSSGTDEKIALQRTLVSIVGEPGAGQRKSAA